MRPRESVAAEDAGQLVDGWLDRMRAPPPELEALEGDAAAWSAGEAEDPSDAELGPARSGWWRRGALAGLLLGAGFGLGAFLLLEEPGPRAAAARTVPDRMFAALEGEPAPRPGPAPDEPGLEEPSGSGTDAPGVVTPDPGPPKGRASGPGRLSRQRPREMTIQYRRLLRRGWLTYNRGDHQEASVAFARAVHLRPDRTDGYFGLALSLFDQGAEDGAMQVLERGVRKVGPKSDLWVLAGSIYQFKGKQRLARLAYQRYLRASPRGRYARDVRVLLSYPQLPQLLSFVDESGDLDESDEADGAAGVDGTAAASVD